MSLNVVLISLVASHTLALGALASPAAEVATSKAALPTVSAPVAIDLDIVDVPAIHAESLDDAVRAEGWMHARERFLQMDLARRQAAGELGSVFPQAVASDRQARPLGLRKVAQRALAAMKPDHRVLLERYAEGVNAFLAANTPLEYRMLKLAPEAWKPEDSMLVQLGMAKYLDSSGDTDVERAAMFASMPVEVARFLTSSAGVQSMSVDGSPLPAPLPLPTAAQLDLHARAAAGQSASPTAPSEASPGSNAFAVAGTRTKDHRAIVGNDMHLALTAPGIWYRVSLEWPKGKLVGLSLPGVPLIVQGTNGDVAWGFTNLTADLADIVIVEKDPKDPTRYLVEGGSEPFVTEEVRLGKAPSEETLTLRSTRFGPIVSERADGTLVAMHWVCLEEGALDCGLFDISFARGLDAALDGASKWHGPPQNVLVASSDGRIGWTIAGSLPRRARATPAPVSWRDAPKWSGLIAPEAKPRIVDPKSGVLTSANQLAIAPSGELAAVIGSDEAPGDRARRMRELLEARSDWTERELHAVQLDVRSARLLRWRDALVAALPKESANTMNAMTAAARDELAAWNGEVGTEACAPELIDACRKGVRAAFATALPKGVANGVSDEAMLRIVEARAPHLLPTTDADWGALVARVLEQASKTCCTVPVGASDAPGATPTFRTRGAANICAIRHPAADALGAAAAMAEMPHTPLPGHPTCVRVQTPGFGASERSVVSPNHLADAILVTPCGQSGLPTSPNFRSLQVYWQKGEPYPLLPGASKRRVELVRALPVAQPAAQPTAPAAQPAK